MAIGDLLSRAVLKVTGDTSDARREINKLAADQEKLGRSMQDASAAGNKGLDSTLAMWTKVAGAAAAAVGAWKLAQVGLEEFDKAAALGEATQGVRIEGLREASRGLKTDMELLTFAAKTNAGAHKLNQEQMQLAIKAMEVYEDRGHDTAEVTEAITNALVKGQARGLKAFGFEIDETATKAQQFDAIMKGLAKDVAEAGTQTDVGSDAMKRSGVEFSNAMSQIKQSIGEIVMALQPLIGALAKVTGLVADVVNYVAAGPGPGGKIIIEKMRRGEVVTPKDILRANGVDPDSIGGARQLTGGTSLSGLFSGDYNYGGAVIGLTPDSAGMGGGQAYSSEAGISAVTREIWARREKERQEKLKVAEQYAKARLAWEIELQRLNAQEAEDVASGFSFSGAGVDPGDVASVTGGAQAAPVGELYSSSGGGILAEQRAANQMKQDMAEMQQIAAGIAHQQRVSVLESMFGPLQEFEGYQIAFQGLTGAVSAAFDAWIDGSASTGQAVKKFLADFAKGIAMTMLVESLKHGAYAIASLIPGPTFNPAAAGGHAKAALGFAAGAAAAGAIARQLGGGAVGGGGGGASGGGGYAGPSGPRLLGANDPQQSRNVTIVLGDDFAFDSPRMREARAGRAIGRALQSSQGSSVYKG